MAFSGGRRQHRLLSDVNITPLVDVTLVLLISFMITVPMLAHGFDVNLPRTTAAPEIPARPDKPPLVIGVPKTNNRLPLDRILVSVDQKPTPMTLDRLAKILKANAGRTDAGRRPVYLRADKDVRYEIVMRVMDVAKASGVTKLGMVTEPEVPRRTGAGR